MHTNFFSQVKLLGLTGNLRINIQPQDNGELIVSLLLDTSFVKDKAAKMIPPLVLKGSENDLDNGFFEAIAKPVQQTQALLLNMQEHIVASDKAQKESRMVKDKQDNDKKEKDSKRKRFDEQMKKVDEIAKQKKIGEAIGQLPDLKSFPEFESEIKKRSQELRSQHGTLSLFGEDAPSESADSSQLADEKESLEENESRPDEELNEENDGDNDDENEDDEGADNDDDDNN
jgi:PRTRC genetic system protein E